MVHAPAVLLLLRRAAGLALAVLTVLLVVPPATSGAAATPSTPTAVYTGTDADGVPQYRLPSGGVPTAVRPSGAAHRADYTATIGGRERVFRLFVPPGLDGRPVPLVVGLHALYSDRRKAEARMGWERLATAGRFVVLYPQGTSASWNAGRCCGGAVREAVDDVAALVEMQRLAGRAYPVDPRRRYVTGMSNGGMMALSLACARPDVVAAVVVVAGAHMDSCRPEEAVPVLQVHGTADDVVPFAGTAHSDFLGVRIPSVADTQRLWATAAPREVSLVRLAGGGHAWPRATGAPGAYDTTGRGWTFLRAQVSTCVPYWRTLARPWRQHRCG